MDDLNIDEAKNLLKSGLAKALLEAAANYTIPIYWVRSNNGKPLIVDNGSSFLLDTGESVFLVTASHVYQGFLNDKDKFSDTTCVLGEVAYDLSAPKNLIANDTAYDVATFRLNAEQIAALKAYKKTALTGCDSRCDIRLLYDASSIFNAPCEIGASKSNGRVEIHYQSESENIINSFVCDAQLAEMFVGKDFNGNVIVRNRDTEEIYKRIYAEVNSRGGYSSFRWPPSPPEIGRGVFFIGFPGKARTLLPYKGGNLVETDWLGRCVLTTVTSISDTNINLLLEADENHIDILPAFPADIDYGGCSGAPILTLVENSSGIYSWRLGGIIYEAPLKHTKTEPSAPEPIKLIKASRADCINADGTIKYHPNPKAYKGTGSDDETPDADL